MSKEPKIRIVGKVCTAGVANTIYTCPDNYVVYSLAFGLKLIG
jgi:hypothetical protein